MERLVDRYLGSERRACRVLRVPRATYRYRSCLDPRTELRMRTREIAQARVRYGYRKMRVLLNREGWDVGKYLVYRLYTEEGLTLKRMKPAGKRKASRTREDRIRRTAPNERLEYGLRDGPVAGWNTVPRLDHPRRAYERSCSDRSRPEPENQLTWTIPAPKTAPSPSTAADFLT